MKNLFKIGMLAVAALAFFGCNRETEIKQDIAGTHVVTVKVTKDFDTRTAIVEGATEASYVWTEGDAEYFHIYENGTAATSVSMSLDDDGLATFTATFPNSSATSFEYTARYFDEESSSHNPVIKADQKPTLTSFDPSADILIAAPQTKPEPATELQFALKRVVSVNKMTLKGLTAGETIESVELATTDKNFSGYYVASSDSYSVNGKKLTFDYSELSTAVVGNDGTFPVYFVTAPVEDATFSVRVTTDQNVYLRDNFTSKLTLTKEYVKRFGIQLGDYGSPISTGTAFTLVESLDDLVDGATYIIVGNSDPLYAMSAQSSNGNNRTSVEVAASNKVITIDNTIAASTFTINSSTGGYTIQDIDTEKYLYTATTSGNRLQSRDAIGDDNCAIWTISIANGVATISNVGNTSRGKMFFNPKNSPKIFNCYASKTDDYVTLSLYVDPSTAIPQPRIVATPAAIEDVDYRGGSFSDLNYELQNLEGEAVITFDGKVVFSAMADPDMEGRIRYSVNPNFDEEDRDGWIKITVGEVVKEVPVSQHGAPSYDIVFEGVEDGKVYVGHAEGDVAEFQINSSYKWTATFDYDNGVTDSYLIDPEEGNADNEESDVTTITIEVFQDNNTGAERFLGTISFNNGGGTPTTVEVWQYGFNGDGSLAHPFNIAGVKTYIDGGGNDNVYVAGKISSAEGGIMYPYDEDHGTATFFISDDGTTNAFEAYQVYFFGNEPWVNGNTQIAVGDEVILYGKVKYYSTGSVYETDSKKAYLYSLNGVTSETVPTIYVTDITDVPAAGVTNATTAVSFANSDGWTASVTPDNTVVTAASISGTTVTYTVAENTGDVRNGSILVTLTKGDRSLSKTINVAQVAAEGQGGTSKTYTITFSSSTMSKFVNSYNSSFVNTCDGLALTLASVNNGASTSPWTEMRAGRKTTASTPTITTNAAIPEAIKTISINMTQVDVSPITSAKVYVSSSSSFTSAEAYDLVISGVGAATATITTPAANKYYKIEIVTNNTGSANGFLRFDKIIYTTN